MTAEQQVLTESFTLDLRLIKPFETGERSAAEHNDSPDDTDRVLVQTDEYASGISYKTELQ